LRELENEGAIEVRYEKNHAHYRFKCTTELLIAQAYAGSRNFRELYPSPSVGSSTNNGGDNAGYHVVAGRSTQSHSRVVARWRVLAMAVNKPTGDGARMGAVRNRSQLKGKLQGKTAWTKRSKQSGRFMDVKKSAKKFKGVRREKVA
jgi:hypothetical protein